MGEALVELEQVLRSQQGKLTPEEANVLLKCKSKAVWEFTAGVLIGGSVAWAAATWKLSKFARVYLSGGAAAFFGMWRFNRAINSCLDHILDLDGSRIQRELANIFVNKHQDDPWTMKRMYRHFYSENVFDDSNSDKPILRWRYRNFFGDNVAYGQRMNDCDSQSDSHIVSHDDSDSKKAHVESKQVPMNPGADVMEDPLDSIFGSMAPVEEIHHLSASSTPARALTRCHRRSHRRHRMLHHKSVDLKPAPQQA
ncbi:hypothetical protein P3X46_006151 [Hevea brasiliensis]|uniref:Uncharacterized protein n=1 Tax=Hevea brasiliensis TaxID=3981 RepID=A0ABQ9MT40_HEVBR|nr:uncharacterized protein LOC110667125 isoform X1 [Hevea brasiliensis]KAJ9182125.1 hypothetical protein P3X46_006151 [Hevea brasiliensis]